MYHNTYIGMTIFDDLVDCDERLESLYFVGQRLDFENIPNDSRGAVVPSVHNAFCYKMMVKRKGSLCRKGTRKKKKEHLTANMLLLWCSFLNASCFLDALTKLAFGFFSRQVGHC